ncbi:hypothetical protein NIES2098_43490 [Calothrix sp. NIES-2098]|nr:hypothetical protein NIES2098_43490 [Calothrix sp. NIES-2098]
MSSIFFGLAWAFQGFLLGGIIPLVFYLVLSTFSYYVMPNFKINRYIDKYVEPIKVIQVSALIGTVFGFFFGFTY